MVGRSDPLPLAFGHIHGQIVCRKERQDLHTLFDRGYLTVTSEYKVEVSQRIKEEFNNGKEYYAMHGTKLGVPESIAFLPDPSLLEWHNERIFVD